MKTKTSRKIEEILRRPYSFLLVPDAQSGYCGKVVEFSGCYAEGDTISEAAENLELAARAWLDAMIEDGQEIPKPKHMW